MRKQTKIIVLSIIMLLIGTLIVNAADATANLKVSATNVGKGDTVTVTLNVACEEGINGLEGTVSYDEEKLELQSIDVGDANWSNLGEELDFAIIHAKKGTITTADILKITFKVKDTAEVGTTAEVTLSDIVLDSDATSNSTKEIGTKEVEFTIVEPDENEPEGNEPGGNEPEGNEPEGNEPGGNEPEGNEPEGNEPEGNEPEGNEPEGNEPEGNEPEGNKKPDNTVANKPIDKAGMGNYIFVITFVAIIGMVSYRKLKEYKNI